MYQSAAPLQGTLLTLPDLTEATADWDLPDTFCCRFMQLRIFFQ